MGVNGRRIAPLDNSRQFNPGDMHDHFQVDTATPTQPAIVDDHYLGTKRIPLDQLVATQDRYNPNKVRKLKGKTAVTKPQVMIKDGIPLLHDGHHRAVLAKQEGKRWIECEAYRG